MRTDFQYMYFSKQQIVLYLLQSLLCTYFGSKSFICNVKSLREFIIANFSAKIPDHVRIYCSRPSSKLHKPISFHIKNYSHKKCTKSAQTVTSSQWTISIMGIKFHQEEKMQIFSRQFPEKIFSFVTKIHQLVFDFLCEKGVKIINPFSVLVLLF